ncbi:putative colanic acid biosynthesis acetyltransferase [Janthinobacterium sp.]|uniref:putative colanic acid biosynthesis acetyltransferase n=1 Tax=Janthinobacterium sp. TaxID=1871054 RepID=UPI00293D5DA3|nr:putative colanic acid biosynthesis acetyltransferase [Janthinobacterium sp.]
MIIEGVDSTAGASFSLKNRLGRALWNVVWLLLFRPSPRPLHAWRAMLLRLFGAKLGQHVHVYAGARIWAPWQLTVGDRVGIADGANIYNMAPISIGSYSVVSQGAHLCAGSHDIDSPHFQLIARPITLHEHVWVCAEAFVGPGVEIAAGCVLGARSVAMRPLGPAWTVWSGHPAVLKRGRTIVPAR